ncbi:ABC transporter ATP-binding protein [Paucibacter sp. R3-3]|uniref:ABC transporter ATP-binding protein n=1 Tax=Roseateles agri TaxID=3098619 RepID=A0ABU5DP13_9BURK|nr:ABC transporter ATP-binding protein [Paucibacter sp. R3-3]MDY0748055.1 ABC transporter ATP-binding protein [Paucibacter sp. R3-3]
MSALPIATRVRAPAVTEYLHAEGVSKQFGAVKALSELSLELRPGEIHGLIGPNGSGKTTVLNVLTGYYPIDAGRIRVGGTDVSALSVQRRVQAGVARTFQKPRILPTLSVLDNVLLGAWRDAAAAMLPTMFATPSARRRESSLSIRARELLAGVGMAHAADERADALEHGEQRFVEIARALASRPRFVLLDEPAGGLSNNEIESLGEVLQAMKAAGIGVMLVEHHTDFVFRLCDRVTAIDFGRFITCGTPQAVRCHPEVIRVYLGA